MLRRIKPTSWPAGIPQRGHGVPQQRFTPPSPRSPLLRLGCPNWVARKSLLVQGHASGRLLQCPGRSVCAGGQGARAVPAARPSPDHPATPPVPIRAASEPAPVPPPWLRHAVSLPRALALSRLCNSRCRFLQAIEVTVLRMEATGERRQQWEERSYLGWGQKQKGRPMAQRRSAHPR